MKLNPKILNYEVDSWSLCSSLYSKSTTRGSYDPMRCVVRIHPELQMVLDSVDYGLHLAREVPVNALSAYSTYIHETIHWWQHIGSTLGLLLSFSYPMQSHVNYERLQDLITSGAYKSLLQYDRKRYGASAIKGETNLNIILNNWHDIEFGRRLLLAPNDAEILIQSPYFESVGHSYYIAWSRFLHLISQSIDPDLNILPDPRTWEDTFVDFKKREVTGYYYGSAIYVPPLGAKAIFEGQARFSQLQYLHFASNLTEDWSDFERIGMIQGIYVEAFDFFLKILEKDRPKSINHPLVALFLLVCDLSINPTEGFPLPLWHFDSFIQDVHPGLRFYSLCLVIRDKYPAMAGAITTYSRNQYIEVSEALSQAILCPSPLEAAAYVANWENKCVEVQELLREESTWEFSSSNLPIRLFLSRFIQFQKDKLRFPELFVWPGVWTTEAYGWGEALDNTLAAFRRNEPLFLDAPDGEVRPRLIPGYAEEAIQNTFKNFYVWNANYNLVRQWHVESGPINLNFGWLTRQNSKEQMDLWASSIFRESFGYDLNDFILL